MPDPRRHVLVAEPVDVAALQELRERWPDLVVRCRDAISPGEILAETEIADCTVLFADHCPANVAVMRRLRWIQLGSAGYQQLAGMPLPDGVRVTNASGVNDIPIAEWCVLMMLTFVRDFVGMLGDQRDRTWSRDVRYQAELRGRRVGVFGYGSIGREVSRLSRSLGLEVWALSRSGFAPAVNRWSTPPPVPVDDGPVRTFTPAELREFLAGLDFLVITAALNKTTAGCFGTTELGWLPPHAVLLNPARAHIVDETALLTALHAGTVAGAALDSHYREPMPDEDPFWSAPNTVVTPHVSGSTGSTHYVPRLWELFSANVDRFLTGRPLLNEISRDRFAPLRSR